MSRRITTVTAGVWVAFACGGFVLQQRVTAQGAKDAALERTRKQVRMVDDLYKTAVVLITQEYVNDVSDHAAGEIVRDWFAAIWNAAPTSPKQPYAWLNRSSWRR